MPKLFSARAKLRWLECQAEKAAAAWERLGQLYWKLHRAVLAGTCDPSHAYKVQLVAARVFFYWQRVEQAMKGVM